MSHQEITAVGLEHKVFIIWPKFLVYVLSFVIPAIFWVSHSIQFHYVRRVNRTLCYINILTLMLVAFIPFSTHLHSEHIELQFAVAFYGTHLMLIWVCEFLQWCYVTTGGRLVDSDIDPHVVSAVKRRIFITSVTYLAAIAVAFISTHLSIAAYGMIIIICVLPGRIDLYWNDGKQ